jgi:ankyrin repeat protein
MNIIEDPLHRAAFFGQINEVKRLLIAGTGFAVDAGDSYALRWAAENGYDYAVGRLIELGVYVNARNGQALYWARKNGHGKTAALLIANGATMPK